MLVLGSVNYSTLKLLEEGLKQPPVLYETFM